jgi:hypothetical protein
VKTLLKEAAEKEKENKPETPPPESMPEPSKKLTEEELQEFLNRHKPKKKIFYHNVTDMDIWK